MAFYGGGERSTHQMYPGPQDQGQQKPQIYNQTTQMHGHQQPGMYHGGYGPPQGHFNEYNVNSMHPPHYGQSQEYFQPQQQGQMYDSGNNAAGHPNQGMGGSTDPRSAIMQPTQMGQNENTKIRRNPFPAVSTSNNMRKEDVYDPSYPTGQFGSQRVAPPPPVISGMSSSGASQPVSMSGQPTGLSHSGPMFSSGNGPGYGMPENSNASMGNMGGMYKDNMYRNDVAYPQQGAPTPAPIPASFSNVTPSYGNNNSNTQQEQSSSKVQIMTGVVTQIQPGAFGMVSGEIFYQEHVVSGPAPKVGDKVVAEAEAVHGMPFKFNAKRVTRLDVDLVHEEKNISPPQVAPVPLQQQQSQPHLQNYQNPEPPQSYQSSEFNRFPINDHGSRFEPPNFGPLPSLPDSLNLPKPVPPPNLASMLPSSYHHSNPPLKSILKRRGSPSRTRNPPPPPRISKKASKEDANLFKSSAPSSFKQPGFMVDLERNIPGVLPPHGSGPPIEFTEYSFVNNHAKPSTIVAPTSPRITRLLPRSPIVEFGGGRNNSVEDFGILRRERSRSQDRGLPKGYKSRSRSKSPKGRPSRRSRSRSLSPRRLRRSRSRSRSPSPSSRRRNYSRSPSPSPKTRRRSRSASPRSRRRRSRSISRDRRPDSRERHSHHSRRSRSRSPTRSPYSRGGRYSPGFRRSLSPPRSSKTGPKILGETVTHGIIVKQVSSDLFPRLTPMEGPKRDVEIIRRDGKPTAKTAGKNAPPPVPIKFQIANAAKSAPTTTSSIVPNPTFKSSNMAPPTYLQNPVFSISNTDSNCATDSKGKKKKSKEQEPAFRIIEDEDKQQQQQQKSKQSPPQGSSSASDDKIKQWEKERQALKSKIIENINASANSLLKDPANILQLKQTIQSDLHELRSKGNNDSGKNLLANSVDIENLKQIVEKNLKDLKSTESTQSKTETEQNKGGTAVINKTFDADVEKRLKDLRSKFESHLKEVKSTTTVTKAAPAAAAVPKPAATGIKTSTTTTAQKVTLVSDNLKDKKIPVMEQRRVPCKPVSEALPGFSRGPSNRHQSPVPIELPPYDEKMERLQEEIHQQRFMEEEHRLKSNNDQHGLQQLFYMEDRRRRRIDERQLARIRINEIQLKKAKNFGELKRLREEWGPSAQRLQQERELRQIRMDEECQENQLYGQAEAIKRQEMEYQRWLEEEAAARSRNMQDSERASRGNEGRVKRRRTPSPSNRGQPPQHGGPPPEPRSTHPLRRRRSRSPSFERYREDWHRRHPRDKSPLRNYEHFVDRYPLVPPPMNSMPPDFYPPNHPGFHDGPPPQQQLEQDGFFIARAMDEASRRQDELMHREMEIQRRIEMAQRRLAGNGGPPHSPHGGEREEIRRFVMPRR